MIRLEADSPDRPLLCVLVQRFRSCIQRRFADDDDFRILNLSFGLLRVPAVGEKERVFWRDQQSASAACEPAKISDVRKISDQESVQALLSQLIPQSCLTALKVHCLQSSSQEPRHRQKARPAGGCWQPGGVFLLTRCLCLDDARSNKEDQLLVGSA